MGFGSGESGGEPSKFSENPTKLTEKNWSVKGAPSPQRSPLTWYIRNFFQISLNKVFSPVLIFILGSASTTSFFFKYCCCKVIISIVCNSIGHNVHI